MNHAFMAKSGLITHNLKLINYIFFFFFAAVDRKSHNEQGYLTHTLDPEVTNETPWASNVMKTCKLSCPTVTKELYMWFCCILFLRRSYRDSKEDRQKTCFFFPSGVEEIMLN